MNQYVSKDFYDLFLHKSQSNYIVLNHFHLKPMQGSRVVHFAMLAPLCIIKVRILVLIKWSYRVPPPSPPIFQIMSNYRTYNACHLLGMLSNLIKSMSSRYSLLEAHQTTHHSNIGVPI
jgi:hypothetical protein